MTTRIEPLGRLDAARACLRGHDIRVPFVLWRVDAGFPSPAEDAVEASLDLNELLLPRPAATFLMRVQGCSMTEAGIDDGDLVVVDRSLVARPGDVVIACWRGEMTIKRLGRLEGRLCLLPDNPAFAPLPVESEADLDVWGVVTYAIHALR